MTKAHRALAAELHSAGEAIERALRIGIEHRIEARGLEVVATLLADVIDGLGADHAKASFLGKAPTRQRAPRRKTVH